MGIHAGGCAVLDRGEALFATQRGPTWRASTMRKQAYAGKRALLDSALATQARRLAAVTAILARHGVAFVAPDGGSCVLVRLPAAAADADREFAAVLKRNHHVAATPASLFGDALRGHVRLACVRACERACAWWGRGPGVACRTLK